VREEVFSIPQAAKYCAVSRWTLSKCVKSGELKASRTPGGHYRILKKDLESFILEKGMYPLANNLSSSKKILIVDDDPKIQKLLSKMLSNEKYETETASTGYEAGAKVVRFKPGLIILDLIMPEMSGFEVCRQVKEAPDTSHIKILAVTGYDTKGNREKIMKAGADGYLAKPLKRQSLIHYVNNLLNTNKSISHTIDETF